MAYYQTGITTQEAIDAAKKYGSDAVDFITSSMQQKGATEAYKEMLAREQAKAAVPQWVYPAVAVGGLAILLVLLKRK